jgi:hypothetical protein
MAEYGRRGRPYYYKAQLMDAIAYLEPGRPQSALRVLQTTLDVLDGHSRWRTRTITQTSR